MKTAKRVAEVVLTFVLCFALSVSVLAADVTLKGAVHLGVTQNSVTSGSYGGKAGQGTVTNSGESAGDVKLTLQWSNGSGWSDCQTVTASPGNRNTTKLWGNTSDFLFRVYLESSTHYLIGNPGRIAYGYVYTDG